MRVLGNNNEQLPNPLPISFLSIVNQTGVRLSSRVAFKLYALQLVIRNYFMCGITQARDFVVILK